MEGLVRTHPSGVHSSFPPYLKLSYIVVCNQHEMSCFATPLPFLPYQFAPASQESALASADPSDMPAVRTRGSNHGAAQGEHPSPLVRVRVPDAHNVQQGADLRLIHTDVLVDAVEASHGGIAFAPTVTPGTFFDPPSPQDHPAESTMFPPSPTDGSPSPARRAGHAKKKPENHIPRPPNAFILFRSSFIKNQHVSSEVETNHSTLSKIIGLTWQNLPNEEKQIWHSKAKLALEEHKRKFPQYTFRPLHSKGKAAEKRKVREVGPKDLKRCEKIAELLVLGKKGAELDAAIAEFDREHVPEVVTRFETPITAVSFRRSSSAPAPDSNSPLLSKKMSVKKIRSRSSQPEVAVVPKAEPQTPPPVQSDSESSESEGSFCNTPSSPYPTTPFSDINPSFVSISRHDATHHFNAFPGLLHIHFQHFSITDADAIL